MKLKINMTTKGPSRKQIIVPMDNDNKSKFMTLLIMYIINLNSVLKNIKSDVIADFICIEQYSIIITTNKVTSPLDLQWFWWYRNTLSSTIEILFENDGYFLPYKNINTPINSGIIETILKNNHIFNNVLIASGLYIVKILPKSNVAIVWLNI